MRIELKIFSITLGIIIGLYLILFNVDLNYPYVIIQNTLGCTIFFTFPGCFIGFILFKKYSKFDLLGIIILLNYVYYSLFGLIFLQLGYSFTEYTAFWAIIIGVLTTFIIFFLKKLVNRKKEIQNIINPIENLPNAAKKFTYILIFIIIISIISTYIIYIYNYPFVYGDLWSHVSIINSLFNGTIPPEPLTIGISEDAVYHSWMSYIFIATGKLIINLPTYQVIFLMAFLEAVIPILLFNFLLDRLLNKESENFYRIKIYSLIFFGFFSGFGGIFVILTYFLLPNVYLSQGTNFLKAIGIFTGDIFDPLKVSGYIIQVFAIGLLFLGIGMIFKILKEDRVKLSNILFFSILGAILMQTHFDICLIFIFLIFIVFFPLIFNNKKIKTAIKSIGIFTTIFTVLTLLFNYLFSNTVNIHFFELISPVITYISKYFGFILNFTPYLTEILIIGAGILSIILILMVKGIRKLFLNYDKIKSFCSVHKSKIIIIMLFIYGFLVIYWIYSVMDLAINWSTGDLPLYLFPTAMGFVLLFSILGIGIKKPLHNLTYSFLIIWVIFLLIVGYSLGTFTFSYTSLQNRLFEFIIPVLDIFAACYLVYLVKNESIWKKLRLTKNFWRVLFVLIVICLGSLSYIANIIVQCQRGLNSGSKLTNYEIQSLDWIRENTGSNSCVFGLTPIMSNGVMVIGQRYTTFYEGYQMFENLIETNSSYYFWYWFNFTKVSHIIVSWERDLSLINNITGSYFETLIMTTNISILYNQNEITIYDVNLMRLEFL